MTCQHSKADFESLSTRREIPKEQFDACNVEPNAADSQRFLLAPGFRSVDKQIQKEQQAQMLQVGLVLAILGVIAWSVISWRKSNTSKPTN